MTRQSNTPARPRFEKVALSLADLCGQDYMLALCANQSCLSGRDPRELAQIATDRVEFFPAPFEQRLVQLLARVGQPVGAPLPVTPAGATTRQFAEHSNTRMAPLGAHGYFRIGEDGKLYLITKSEHYHAPLGHSFPGYGLIDRARQLGIPNATHNNTRGSITRRLEEELVCRANGVDIGDMGALKALLASSSSEVLNRVLNLETGSLAVEAALKLVLARFYRSEATSPQPKYGGRIPVLLVMGDDDGGLKANYHGTTMLTQIMRGMWPELFAGIQERGFRVVPIRPNCIPDLETAFKDYERDGFKIAAFFHEIVMMNYGGRLLSREFLQRAYDLCRSHDVPAVVDEIQSCLWAPGLFLFREYGLRPSFVALGKGFPGGEYAASRILFSAAFDSLAQFGALVTNGQEELASLAYLVTMRWAEANTEVTRSVGDYYACRLQGLAEQFPGALAGVDGSRHMSCLRFKDKRGAAAFVGRLLERGLDASMQSYKPDAPPVVLTKLPLIAGYEVVDFVLDRMEGALRETGGAVPTTTP
ncbi:MAG TPA: aminotransferase class III-fold pyridoxal phosphate-dependent enzyme [Verrucomicrobiota bacterium]|nr:aminotransferase class III-fold pyridoxal phosphate-dependent enzyme [Verrucomicrobiota bacterium]HQL76910.1 aminotransferase class III-fold pyridoxal phosphate-dependent enzyme [Verrucomicrobiota bacterium]